MNPFHVIGVVVNVDAELMYWRSGYMSSGFYRRTLRYEDYVPSLKFAYDAYLTCHKQPLREVLPGLHQRYETRLPAQQRLDWEIMRGLLISVWERLHNEHLPVELADQPMAVAYARAG